MLCIIDEPSAFSHIDKTFVVVFVDPRHGRTLHVSHELRTLSRHEESSTTLEIFPNFEKCFERVLVNRLVGTHVGHVLRRFGSRAHFYTVVRLVDDVSEQSTVDEASDVLHSTRHRPALVIEPPAVSKYGDALAVVRAQLGEFVPECHSVSEVTEELCCLASHHSLFIILKLCRSAQSHPETLLLG